MIRCQKTAFILALLAVFALFLPAADGNAELRFKALDKTRMQDADTGLEWAVDAGTPSFGKCTGGKKTWQAAVVYVNCLNAHRYLGHKDWRLPSPHEFSLLISKIALESQKEHDYKIEIAAPKLKEVGFRNIQPSMYWSSASAGDNVAMAIEVLTTGESHPMGKMNTLNVWPVRGTEKTTGR